MDNFTNIKYEISNLDNYLLRTKIFEGIKKYSNLFGESLLDVGCGKMPYKDHILANSKVKNYIGLDIEGGLEYDEKIKPDMLWDGFSMPFEEEIFDTAIAIEVIEHLFEPEITVKEINRVLKKGGLLFFTVPFLWNLHEVPNDAYRYTPYSLERLFLKNGFSKIEIFAQGGWNSSLAQMLGLWVRRSPMGNKKRSVLSHIIKPIIKYLISRDNGSKINFNDSPMITGLYGVANR